MFIFKNTITRPTLPYNLSKLSPLEDILFIDIETTGLSPKNTHIYMIGLAYVNDSNNSEWIIEQFFAQTSSDEKELLTSFLTILSKKKFLIHFNGDKFDIPFIKCRAEHHLLDTLNIDYDNFDIYKTVKNHKAEFGLINCKQKSIEIFLGINREDKFSGKELIDVYKEYCSSPNDELLKILLQHNYDDIVGMLDIIGILNYTDLFNSPQISIKQLKINNFTSIEGISSSELHITIKSNYKLQTNITLNKNGCFLLIRQDTIYLKIPIIEDKMKYFYDNYKDYYYLPEEDMAIHKSVGEYVDKEHRLKATPSTCYTTKTSKFLPQWINVISPAFTKEYNDTEKYFEFKNEYLEQPELLNHYVSHIIKMICNK